MTLQLTAAWARRKIAEAGMTTSAPITDLYDQLVEDVAAARPNWSDNLVWKRADDLANLIAE